MGPSGTAAMQTRDTSPTSSDIKKRFAHHVHEVAVALCNERGALQAARTWTRGRLADERERHHGLKSWDEHGTKGAGQAANATSRKIQK